MNTYSGEAVFMINGEEVSCQFSEIGIIEISEKYDNSQPPNDQMGEISFTLTPNDKNDYDYFFNQMKKTRYGIYEEIMSSKRTMKFRELVTGEVYDFSISALMTLI